MYETYKIKKYAVDKVAFLGLFIAALLLARVLIVLKASVTLSGPIKLNCADLSVQIPAGKGWQNDNQWMYQENAFTLTSIFVSKPGSVTALARCQYLLAEPILSVNEQFKQKALAMDANIEKTGHIQIKTPGSRLTKNVLTKTLPVIEWTHIKKQKTLFDIFFGTVRLPNNRQLNIEVHDTTGDADFAEKLFKDIVKSLKFKDNQLLIAGSEIVEEIKKTGLSRLLASQDQETFFLIKEDVRQGTANHIVGFMMDTLTQSAGKPSGNKAFNIQATNFYYIKGRNAQEHIAFFQSDNNFNEFMFKGQTIPANEAGSISVTELIFDKTGKMSVRKLHKQTSEKIYRPGLAAIPEVFLEQLFQQMLHSKYKKIIVDIISADGKIIPAIISRIEPQNTTAAKKTSYALIMELEDGRGLSEKIYLNNQKHVSKILLEKKTPSGQSQNIYTLDRTNIKHILRTFPERADYILKQSKTLEQNQSGRQEFF